jgi:hypothetical protein
MIGKMETKRKKILGVVSCKRAGIHTYDGTRRSEGYPGPLADMLHYSLAFCEWWPVDSRC